MSAVGSTAFLPPAAFVRSSADTLYLLSQEGPASASFIFYMGKHTPERQECIMDKLVVPVEE
jgi:hypothetical protein